MNRPSNSAAQQRSSATTQPRNRGTAEPRNRNKGNDMTTSGHHYLVELYTPKPAWRTLAPEQRERFPPASPRACKALERSGSRSCLWAGPMPGSSVPRAIATGIWRCADAAARDALLAGIEASGWYGYFEHVNAAGGGGGLASHRRSWPGTEDGLARPAAARSVRRDLADLDDLLPAREFTGRRTENCSGVLATISKPASSSLGLMAGSRT